MQFNHLLFISLALIQITTAEFFTPVAYNSTENWSIVRHIYRFPPLIVQSNGNLIHVLDSDDPENAIHLYSAEYGLCKVPLKLDFHQRYPRRAITLGNGKIVIWLLNYRLTHVGSRVSLHEAKWRFTIVEPRNCNTAPSILAIKDSEVTRKPVDVVDVVGYDDYFEVFLNPLVNKNQKNIYGFSYYENGAPIRKPIGNDSVIPDHDIQTNYHPNTIKIHTVQKHDSSLGYFYLKVKPKLRETFINRFDANFKPTQNVTLEKSSESYERYDSYSINHGNLTYCRHEERHLNCSLLDSSLQFRFNVSFSYEKYVDHLSKISRLSVTNTADGGALLFIGVDSNYHMGLPVYMQKIHGNGKISGVVSIGRFFCEIRSLNSYEMPDGSYCICVVCDEHVHTRCFRSNSNDVVEKIASDEENDNDL